MRITSKSGNLEILKTWLYYHKSRVDVVFLIILSTLFLFRPGDILESLSGITIIKHLFTRLNRNTTRRVIIVLNAYVNIINFMRVF